MPEEELPADLRQSLRSLMAAPAAATAPPSHGADRFVYTVRHGGQEVTVGEQALDPDARRLVQWVINRPA